MSLADELLADLDDDNDEEELEEVKKEAVDKSDDGGEKIKIFLIVYKFIIFLRKFRSRRWRNVVWREDGCWSEG